MRNYTDLQHPPVQPLSTQARITEFAKVQTSKSAPGNAQATKVVAASVPAASVPAASVPLSGSTNAPGQSQNVQRMETKREFIAALAGQQKPDWRQIQEQREAADAARKAEGEKQYAAMVEKIIKQYTRACEIQATDNMFFRACGSKYSPKALLANGFRSSRTLESRVKLKELLADLYCCEEGIFQYLVNFGQTTGNNRFNAPFISSGKEPNDAQGSSSGYWQFAIQVEGLEERPVTASLLGLGGGRQIKTEGIRDVKLFMDKDSIEAAGHVMLRWPHGTALEYTFLDHIPRRNIIAWIRLGGAEWQRMWRPFTEDNVNGIYNLTKECGFNM